MNNEELKEQIEIYKNERDTYKRLAKSVIKQNNKLEDENEKLKQRIDKAIDYLEQPPVIEINGEFRNIYSEDDDKLLKILKGN